jgi:hypothetical protein
VPPQPAYQPQLRICCNKQLPAALPIGLSGAHCQSATSGTYCTQARQRSVMARPSRPLVHDTVAHLHTCNVQHAPQRG